MQARHQPRSGLGGLMRLLLLVSALACFFAAPGLAPRPGVSGQAEAATAPVRKPTPIRPTGYMVDVQDEVMAQNLTCDEISRFQNKPPDVLPIEIAEEILDEPQHAQETSKQLFGDTLTRLILSASGGGTCTMIVPSGSAPNSSACSSERVPRIISRGMDAALAIPAASHPGELHLLGYFDHAAKLKNCRR
ncbi:MAG: hypothetical protein JWM33_2555 [Caulobacteraceae bacterium]|nr:hypothetical protein [Caulobacteraceae bacterium]